MTSNKRRIAEDDIFNFPNKRQCSSSSDESSDDNLIRVLPTPFESYDDTVIENFCRSKGYEREGNIENMAVGEKIYKKDAPYGDDDMLKDRIFTKSFLLEGDGVILTHDGDLYLLDKVFYYDWVVLSDF
jgi:hemin uptake protein HemP